MIRFRSVLGRVSAALLALALCGCGAGREEREARESRANVYPVNFKADITGALRAYLIDPTNIRDAYVADPAIKTIGAQSRFAACLRFNAKNGDGRYQGSRDMLAVFVAGRYDHFVDPQAQPSQANQSDTPDLAAQVKEQCKDAEFKRFAELEALPR